MGGQVLRRSLLHYVNRPPPRPEPPRRHPRGPDGKMRARDPLIAGSRGVSNYELLSSSHLPKFPNGETADPGFKTRIVMVVTHLLSSLASRYFCGFPVFRT